LKFKKQSDVGEYVITYVLKCVPTIAALYSIMVASVVDFLPQLTVKQRKKRRNRRKNTSEPKCYNESAADDEHMTTVHAKNEEALELIDHNRFRALRLFESNQ
jgi:flagellar biosynthesis component FlhA